MTKALLNVINLLNNRNMRKKFIYWLAKILKVEICEKVDNVVFEKQDFDWQLIQSKFITNAREYGEAYIDHSSFVKMKIFNARMDICQQINDEFFQVKEVIDGFNHEIVVGLVVGKPYKK